MRDRQHFVGAWLGDKELAHLRKQCAVTGLSVSAFVRKAIAGVQLRPRPPGEYGALLRELAAIGNNINQIAYWANARKSIHEPEIVEAAVLANEAWRLVKDKL
ncbi:MAG TPA: plasmid mobilization relaxosome protein MobC [Candidatus Limivicinus faecipullorum]|nr:plasmid mobilization relaxosome protein MobC [Candidatus Limivicinus faecipullorum]